MEQTYYDQIADSYNQLYGEEQKRKLKQISDFLDEEDDDLLLDVGCGSGLAEKFFNCVYYGIDPSIELLKEASGKVVQAKAEDIPFKSSVFDIVICVSSIHNFENPKRAIEEMKRVGKDKFVITVLKKSTDKDKIRALIDLIKGEFTIEKEVQDKHDHIFFARHDL